MIEGRELCGLIPHSGDMCLLDKVEAWSRTSIQCSTQSHLSPGNPLRVRGQLAALHAIEYGAQAMAIHGSLLARELGRQPVPGVIAALRDIRLHVDCLHDQPHLLDVQAHALLQNSDAMIYRFRIEAGDVAIADGRITVMTAAGG